MVNITYLGHACFLLEAEGYRTVLDPYANGAVPGLMDLDLAAEAVYCSHGHGDHNAADRVKLTRTALRPPYTLAEIPVPHDDAGGAKRGMCTARVFDFGGLRVAHLGDIGRTLTQEEAEILAGVDCLLLPVGGFFTVDAAQAAQIVRQAGAKVVIPMHYRTKTTGYPVIGKLDRFTRQFETIYREGDTLTLTPDTPAGVHVLKQKMAKGEES